MKPIYNFVANISKSQHERVSELLQNIIAKVYIALLTFLLYISIQEAENDLTKIEESIDQVKGLCNKLAVHYCENEKSFKVDEFVEAFKDFCDKVKTCEQELETWRVMAEKAEQRRKTQLGMSDKRKGK